ncbi:MAG: hypothetical protein P8P74_17175 [Crocinitomicaceae bacterium]|nr:hypothetical protein [Crocinitomicaceae bacterium]
MNIYKYIFYSIILIAYLIFQTGLKEEPQTGVLYIAVAVILFYHLKQNLLFRIFNFVLITALTWSFVFQVSNFLWDWINPNRGQIMVDGRVETVMDMSGIFVAGLSFVIALICAIMNWRNIQRKTIQPEYHLAMATLIASGIVFIYFEVL